MNIGKLQFVSNYQSKLSHIEQVKQVISGGVNWIQYRPKDVNNNTILLEGKTIAQLCAIQKVKFIMNDRVDIAKKLNADGVHLGKNDMSPVEARKLLGSEKIIGGTANSYEDIVDLVAQGVNYIGLGPFRFTSTKKNLSPVVGMEGYKNIIESLNKENIKIPIVAIGGIVENDVQSILNMGIYGIAVSSVISDAINVRETAEQFVGFCS